MEAATSKQLLQVISIKLNKYNSRHLTSIKFFIFLNENHLKSGRSSASIRM